MDIESEINRAIEALDLKPAGVNAELLAAYGCSHRFYHNLEHIKKCLSLARETGWETAHLVLAICYHDVVYNTRSSDNERRSADWAIGDLRFVGARDEDCCIVERLIMATTHQAMPSLMDEKMIVDIDLSILSEAPQLYANYATKIRREYDWISDADFQAGRRLFLSQMLARPFIYATGYFQDLRERQARENLERELETLQPG